MSDLSQINRDVCEWLGICWHHAREVYTCSCGVYLATERAIYWHCINSNPNFIAHPVELLREMRKRDDWPEFITKIHVKVKEDSMDDLQQVVFEVLDYIVGNYILDTTGTLLRAVEHFPPFVEWNNK